MPDQPLGLNPYVGPRPFHAGETLFGRGAEIRDLYYLLNAERIVLLHSPSGAGKSSLVQAGLLPQLKQSNFDVWPTIRISSEPPEGNTVNRYVRSTILSLEEELPERLRRDTATLSALNLEQYVLSRPRKKAAAPNVTLIFDQFEEILTVDPLGLDLKREFFTQLGDLLRHRDVWALFVIREDYLAPLDPYATLIPTQFKNRFRLDLLGLDAARDAIEQPAQSSGRVYAANVAERLVGDLASVSVQLPDGSFVKEKGHTVEPVQLQVVCRRLWDELPADDRSIDPEDVDRFGDVTQALGAYYDLSVGQVAGDDRNCERSIREWFSDKLITRGGIRGQVLQGVSVTEGLDNKRIYKLLDTHLIRSEKRRGATWYELAHDRLLDPVSRSNVRWFETNLEEFQRRASIWEKEGHPEGLLLIDEDLKKAETRLTGLSSTEIEKRFLEASRKKQGAVDATLRQSKRIRLLAIASSLVGIVAIVAAFIAWQQRAAIASTLAALDKEKSETKKANMSAQEAAARASTAAAEAQTAAGAAEQARKARDKLFLDLLTRHIQFTVAQAVPEKSVPGPVNASGPDWSTIIKAPIQDPAPGGRTEGAFAVARSSTSTSAGHILAVGHNGLLDYGFPEPGKAPVGDNVFLEVAMTWLRGDRGNIVFMSTKPTDGFLGDPRKWPWLRQKFYEWGYQSIEGADLSDASKLDKAAIVVIGNSGRLSDKEIDALVRFVDQGGGLLATGIGWAWIYYGSRIDGIEGKKMPLEEYGMNRLLKRFGAEFTSEYLERNSRP